MTTMALQAAPVRRRKVRPTDAPGGWGSYLGLIILAASTLLPLGVLLMNSLKSEAELAAHPLGFPTSLHFENYANAWSVGGMGGGLATSVTLVFGTVLGVWLVAGPAAYALGRLELRGTQAVLLYLVTGAAIPVQMFLIPLFFLWTRIGLYDSVFGLIVLYVALNAPLATLLLRSFLAAIPKELDEAGRIDGASSFQVFRFLILPLSTSGFLTVGLVAGLAAYNEFLFAVTFITSSDQYPVSTVFFSFQQGFSSNYSLINAAAVIMLIPPLLLFLLLQRRFTSGLTSSGLKG